jgi:hypothetical protein
MKIKASFVTNSSSTTFILSSNKKILKTKLFNYKGRRNVLHCQNIRSVEELVQEVQFDFSYDFINEMIGPREYCLMPKPQYLICKKEITQKNRYISILEVNHHVITDEYYRKIYKSREHTSDANWIEFFENELFKPNLKELGYDIQVIFKNWG